MHLAQVLTHVPPDLGIGAGFDERLHPQVRDHGAILRGAPRANHRLVPQRRIGLSRHGLVPDRAHPIPGLGEAGEVEVALGGEVPVQDRFRDTGFAGDFRGGRASVASRREDPAGRVDQRGAPFSGCEARPSARLTRPRGAHSAASAAAACTSRAPASFDLRIRIAAVTAPAKATIAPTRSATWNPSRNASRGRRSGRERTGLLRREDRAHHCDAERPADLSESVQYARRDACLGDRHGPHRRRGHRRHRRGDADAADDQPGQQIPEVGARARAARTGGATGRRASSPPAMSQREPTRSESRPASGATTTDRAASSAGRSPPPGPASSRGSSERRGT